MFCNDHRKELDDSEFYPSGGPYCRRHQAARNKATRARKLSLQTESDQAIGRLRMARAEEAQIVAQLERDRQPKFQIEDFEPLLPRMFGGRPPVKERGWSCPMRGACSTS